MTYKAIQMGAKFEDYETLIRVEAIGDELKYYDNKEAYKYV